MEWDGVHEEDRLSTLDIFAGCGGLSQGLKNAGVSETKWAIEYEASAAQTFRQNHPNTTVYVNACSVILRAIMEIRGDQEDCISPTEVDELAAKLSEDEKSTLPMPGQVDFIIGAPRYQAGMKSEISASAEVQTFLSFVEYFRPKYVLMETVATFQSHNAFRLTEVSLLKMGYQVRHGILEAGAYGVSQSCQRIFIWAAATDEVLPEWPKPLYAFDVPALPHGLDYADALRNAQGKPPHPTITVRDTIGDLPAVESGDSTTHKEYPDEPPVSWFQNRMRGNTAVLTDHICKVMSGQNNIRLDWEGNFPTIDPQVGMWLHPEQDRMVTVRECARSKGFPDNYVFSGTIDDKYRQIEDAVPPPLACVLGRKLKEVLPQP